MRYGYIRTSVCVHLVSFHDDTVQNMSAKYACAQLNLQNSRLQNWSLTFQNTTCRPLISNLFMLRPIAVLIIKLRLTPERFAKLIDTVLSPIHLWRRFHLKFPNFLINWGLVACEWCFNQSIGRLLYFKWNLRKRGGLWLGNLQLGTKVGPTAWFAQAYCPTAWFCLWQRHLPNHSAQPEVARP